MTKKLQYSLLVLLLCLTGTVFAAPQISLQMQVEKEVSEVNEEGETVTRRLEANEAEPGDTLYYTIRYINSGDEAARDVRLDNPLPSGTAYVEESAFGEGTDIFFSADGEVFKKPGNLTYEVDGGDGERESRRVTPDSYVAIRWVVEEIPAGESGTAGFSVTVQ